MPRDRLAAGGTEGASRIQKRDPQRQSVDDGIEKRSGDQAEQADRDPGNGRQRGVAQRGSGLLAGQTLLDDLTENMKQELLRLLDAGRLRSGNDQFDIGCSFGEAATLAQEGDRGDPATAGLLESGENVARLSAGGQDDENIPLLTESRDLTRKDLGEIIVIPDGREQSRVDREGHRRIGAAILLEPAGELRGQMGAVARAASVAAEHQLVPGEQGISHGGGGLLKISLQRGERGKNLLQGVQGTLELAHRKRHWTGARPAVKGGGVGRRTR